VYSSKLEITVTNDELLYTLFMGKIVVTYSGTYNSQVIFLEIRNPLNVDMLVTFSLSSKVHGMFVKFQEFCP
jgi:hypothetical protein